MAKQPFIFHDLQDSQIFALAQAAGRAGFEVKGTVRSLKDSPWLQYSRYISSAAEMPSLGAVNQGLYTLNLKKAGVTGVFVPMVDDIARFIAEFAPLLRKNGLSFLTVHPQQIDMCDLSYLQQWTGKLNIPKTVYCDGQSLLKAAESVGFPVIFKSFRDGYVRFDCKQDLSLWLASEAANDYPFQLQQRVQQYIAGETTQMASALLLFDGQSRPIRGFTARRIRVAQTLYGPFGETVAAKAEWLPDLYEAALELLSALGWVGFAEVECKQDATGKWFLLEINPRLSGWTCFAEADGAGLLQAYHHLCTEDTPLEHACLQRSVTNYSRMIASNLHQPDWQNFSCTTLKTMLTHPNHYMFGAWDKHDSKANRSWLPLMFKRYLTKH